MTAEQFNHILDMEAAAGASTAKGGSSGAPAASPASGDGASTPSTAAETVQNDGNSATLTLNGNNPATWPLGASLNDNLGALFTHDGISETIYSTSTVDTTIASTTTIDYWAVVLLRASSPLRPRCGRVATSRK
jgi:hypothetical protein